ncbi:unnamed protein product [Sphenostylis stenocarpa]|uniref:Uncharacterized protein n=1 Tax=Sphenostylis stenocarpa TaxID=92480 RepID=A0AA86SS06_9FABA|nr:unnamed protein product [Sphenostylis stenocarpa]
MMSVCDKEKAAELTVAGCTFGFSEDDDLEDTNGKACVEGFIGGWRDCDEMCHLMLTEEREHNPGMVKGVFAFVGSVLSLPLSSSHSHAFAF